jgi:hypothetical protein
MKKMNKLYVVAGKRNMGEHARLNGGLFVNVGMTTRTVDERLGDQDYRNKAAGGVWEVIVRDHEIGSHDDTEIHDELKKRDDVVWSLDGLNTEEFLFVNDPGDGSVARDIVLQIAKNLSPRDKCIEPDASIEQELLGRGIPHAGEVRKSNDSVCWLRVKSVIERNGPYGKYVILYFDSKSRDKAIFVWNSAAKQFPVGDYVLLGGVRVSKRGNLECKGQYRVLVGAQHDERAPPRRRTPDEMSPAGRWTLEQKRKEGEEARRRQVDPELQRWVSGQFEDYQKNPHETISQRHAERWSRIQDVMGMLFMASFLGYYLYQLSS